MDGQMDGQVDNLTVFLLERTTDSSNEQGLDRAAERNLACWPPSSRPPARAWSVGSIVLAAEEYVDVKEWKGETEEVVMTIVW